MRALWMGTVVLASCASHSANTSSSPRAKSPVPDTHRGDVVETIHGVEIADPYRWLEDPDSAQTKAWVVEQNQHSQAHLQALPLREPFRELLDTAWTFEHSTPPSVQAGAQWFHWTDGTMQHSQLMRRSAIDADPEVILDPNTFSEDGTVSLSRTALSKDGHYLAYATSDGGSDWNTFKVRDLRTGADTDDLVQWSKFGTATWLPDNTGFLYPRFPAPSADVEVNRDQSVWLHRLGTPQSDDVMVFDTPNESHRSAWPHVTEDGQYVVYTLTEGTAELTRVYVAPIEGQTGRLRISDAIVKVFDAFDAHYIFLGNIDKTFYFRTDADAPRGRVIAVDLDAPEPANWQQVIPQADSTLQNVTLAGQTFIAHYLQDAASAVRVFDLEGNHVRDMALPGVGTAAGFVGPQDATELYFSFESFGVPPQHYRYDVQTGEVEQTWRAEFAIDLTDVHTEQIFVESKDGTKVPAFVSWKGDLVKDGTRPTFLYGYGGFNISLTPRFRSNVAAWLEMGGVYVYANLRGGGEYGRDWHHAGTLTNKQNVFDDAIAVAEHLIADGITSPEHLALHGRSNGGLLAAATMLQRPDLFAAVVPGVGVLDMLRYHLFTIGWAWASDYGTADDADVFPALLAYSPVHNAVAADYPATLITTADHDDRVVPAHSYKFAAALQRAQTGNAPVLIRIETRGGHGAGKSRDMAIEEWADVWSFVGAHTGMAAPTAP